MQQTVVSDNRKIFFGIYLWIFLVLIKSVIYIIQFDELPLKPKIDLTILQLYKFIVIF